jgi:CubicO group peptidase (beta-lactamase class C family)
VTGPAVRTTLLNLAVLLAVIAPRAEAQRGWTDLTRRFDAFAQAAGVVGGSAVLVRKGTIVARHHFGFADLAAKRRVTDRTIYHWASVTKTLTAIGVLQLRDRGLLTLDDRITRWVPELREIHDPDGLVDSITIRMLLSHSSGLQNPTWPWSRGEPWEPFEPTAWGQLVAMMPYQRLQFRSGSRYGYSNPGYIYLARVIEKLTGDPWAVYVQKNLWTPHDLAADRSHC